jgi:hypothetical protein
MHFKTQDDLKHHVERLKSFYNEFYCFLIAIAFTVLLWLLLGGGYFFPVWLIVIWGGSIFFKASKLEILDASYYKLLCSLRGQLPFLKKSWEHDKLQELQKSFQGKIGEKIDAKPHGKATSAEEKKTPVKKATVKKSAVKKPTVSKAVTKRAPVTKKKPVKNAAKTTAKTVAKAAVKKAPVKKEAVKKAPAKRSPAKGTPKKK